MPARVPVTAVLVAHDGSRWLPSALSALASSSVKPDRVVAVDTGSVDGSADLLRRSTSHVLHLPRDTGYAAAVRAALAAVPADSTWVWLLHDDCAPDPGLLAGLLRAAAADPDAVLLGPRVVDWDDPRVLVEMGCSTDVLGVRDGLVEPGELDQGQHEQTRQVLAVGTAGALVRRDAWEQVGGLEPALPLFRDDLDLGRRLSAAGHRVLVVPQVRLRHARAATLGLREIDCAAGPPLAADREAAVLVQLAHARVLPLAALAVGLLCVLRAVLRLLRREPAEARAELSALRGLRPTRLRRLRRARRGPHASVRPLLSTPFARGRARLAASYERARARRAPGPARTPAGPLLVTGLTVLALLAGRDLLGRGVLAGGRLLPALPGATDLWQSYAEGRDPALALLAVLTAPLLGRPGTGVELLLLGAVPLAGAVAYAVAGRVVRSLPLRVWAAATWALLPVATGAVAAGRLDAAAVHVVLPALLVGGQRVTARPQPRHRVLAYGLGLAAAVALAPLLWLLAVASLLGGALVRLGAVSAARRPAALRGLRAAALALAVPPLLLLPWSPQLLDPAVLLHGPGRLAPGLADPDLPAWHLLLLQPGGPGTPGPLLAAGLLLAGLGGLLRTRRAQIAAAGWGLALTGLAVALVLARTSVGGAPVWPGLPLDLAAAGLLLAALIGAEGLQERLSRASFGGRQLAAVAVVVLAAAVPVLSAAEWVRRGADGPLQRDDRAALPAFAQAELAARPGTRALLLEPRPDGSVGYAVTGPYGPRLGDSPAGLDEVVADLLTPRGGNAPARAAAEGVVFVASRTGLPALDAQPGLDRQPGERPLWRVAAPVTPAVAPAPGGLPLPLQALALLLAVVLAAPGAAPRRGLERVRR